MRRVALVCLLIACGDDGGDGPLPTGPITATVTAYDYAFDIDTRAAHAKLTLDVTTGGDCITLPFRAQNVTNALLGEEPATAVVEGEMLKICGVGQRIGASELEVDLVIPLATLSTSQVGYSITKDSEQNSFYYLVSWVGGCDRFAPCDNRSDQFATYHFTVTHPANYKARCPGTISEVSATQTECAFEHEGGPTYSTFGVAAYPAWTIADKGTWGGVRVDVYDRASTGITAAIDTAYHAGFVDFMQQRFGPYPYGNELRILTAPTYWSGFEHPGNIVLDDGLAKTTNSIYANPTAHVLDHEIVHMWAGDQTTLATTYDFVWKEAMAEYLTYVYEDVTSATVGRRTAGGWKLLSQDASFFPVPTSMPALFDYYGDAYGPGPMVLFRQLEVLTSREQVVAGIQAVLGGPRALSVDELIAALETSTGLDLDAYAAAWIKGSGEPDWPRYNVVFTAGAGTSTLALDQTNEKAQKRGCKFHVALRGANMEEVVHEVDTFTGAVDQTLTIPTPAFTVTTIALDPYAECLVYLMSSTPRTVRRRAWITDRAGPFAPIE
ncbi:MAG TPA: M1 family aminopeptidase [Kofleriaceae bacterium]